MPAFLLVLDYFLLLHLSPGTMMICFPAERLWAPREEGLFLVPHCPQCLAQHLACRSFSTSMCYFEMLLRQSLPPWPGRTDEQVNNGCDYGSEFKANLKKHIRKHDYTNGISGERACLPVQAEVRDVGSIPGSGRSPGGGNDKPTPVFLPGESHGQTSMTGYSPWGHRVGHDWVHFNVSERSAWFSWTLVIKFFLLIGKLRKALPPFCGSGIWDCGGGNRRN